MIRHIALIGLVAALAQPAFTQSSSHPHTDVNGAATEPGQGAFAVIAEITEILANDPHTDWELVDIAALREHLMDMDLMTLESSALQRDVESGAQFIVSADGRAREAVQRMITAHAPVLADATGWVVSAEIVNEGGRLMVTSANASDVARIRGLGFYGAMATGAHHQEHHLQIALGSSPN